MSDVLLSVERLSKSFGGFRALTDVALTVAAGERLGIIGPNGSGKTTLINCVSGVLRPETGRTIFAGIDISSLPAHARTRLGICRSFQIPRPFASMTVVENLLVPINFVGRSGSVGSGAARDEAMALLRRFRLEDKANSGVKALSQVDLRKLELARALAARTKLLVSDESMAGLSSSEVDEVLDILADVSASGVAIIMIEHIMRAMMRFSQRIICLDAGCVIAEGRPDAIRNDENVQRAYLGARTDH